MYYLTCLVCVTLLSGTCSATINDFFSNLFQMPNNPLANISNNFQMPNNPLVNGNNFQMPNNPLVNGNNFQIPNAPVVNDTIINAMPREWPSYSPDIYYGRKCSRADQCGKSNQLVCPYGYCECPIDKPFLSAGHGDLCVATAPSTCDHCGENASPCTSASTCRRGLVCTSAMCSCPSTSPYYLGAGQCTATLPASAVTLAPVPGYNQQCAAAFVRCSAGLTCINNTCSCPYLTPNYANGTCLQGGTTYNGQNCTLPTDCGAPFVCASNGICMCPSDAPNYVNGQCQLPGATYGQACGLSRACTSLFVCINGACACPWISPSWNGQSCTQPSAAGFGQPCGPYQPCATSFVCSNGLCGCPGNAPMIVGGQCQQATSANSGGVYGQSCGSYSPCNVQYVCTNGACSCPWNAPYFTSGICQSAPSATTTTTVSS